MFDQYFDLVIEHDIYLPTSASYQVPSLETVERKAAVDFLRGIKRHNVSKAHMLIGDIVWLEACARQLEEKAAVGNVNLHNAKQLRYWAEEYRNEAEERAEVVTSLGNWWHEATPVVAENKPEKIGSW